MSMLSSLSAAKAKAAAADATGGRVDATGVGGSLAISVLGDGNAPDHKTLSRAQRATGGANDILSTSTPSAAHATNAASKARAKAKAVAKYYAQDLNDNTSAIDLCNVGVGVGGDDEKSGDGAFDGGTYMSITYDDQTTGLLTTTTTTAPVATAAVVAGIRKDEENARRAAADARRARMAKRVVSVASIEVLPTAADNVQFVSLRILTATVEGALLAGDADELVVDVYDLDVDTPAMIAKTLCRQCRISKHCIHLLTEKITHATADAYAL
jgi:hypothetical protein